MIAALQKEIRLPPYPPFKVVGFLRVPDGGLKFMPQLLDEDEPLRGIDGQWIVGHGAVLT